MYIWSKSKKKTKKKKKRKTITFPRGFISVKLYEYHTTIQSVIHLYKWWWISFCNTLLVHSTVLFYSVLFLHFKYDFVFLCFQFLFVIIFPLLIWFLVLHLDCFFDFFFYSTIIAVPVSRVQTIFSLNNNNNKKNYIKTQKAKDWTELNFVGETDFPQPVRRCVIKNNQVIGGTNTTTMMTKINFKPDKLLLLTIILTRFIYEVWSKNNRYFRYFTSYVCLIFALPGICWKELIK